MSIKCPKCQSDNLSDSKYCKECGSPLTSESEKEHTETITRTKTLKENQQVHPIENIGPYKILEVLGSGGLGTVYLAQQEKPIKRKVALKIIKPGMNSEEIIARFESEQQALALMNHPNIAQVYDSGSTEKGYPYFVMEYVPGPPITEYCDRHKMTTQERLILFQDVCNAVQHAHYKGIVHRDLKPSNVLVTFQNDTHVPKIIDFGIAKALTGQGLTEKTLHTLHNVAIGTPAYMSPEQAELTGYDIDTRTDVYSLGILLYELLVGVTPFDEHELERAGLAEILRIIREVEPPKPTTRFNSLGETSNEVAKKRGTTPVGMVKQLKGDLECILMKAVEKDRKRRYGSAAELAEDINRFLDQKPIHARPPSFLYTINKYIRRHKAASVVAILILLVIIIFSFWNTWERQKAEKSLREANFNFAAALKERAKLYAEKKEWNLVKLYGVNSLLYQTRARRFIPMGDIDFPTGYQDLKLKYSIFSPYNSLYSFPWINMSNYSPDIRWRLPSIFNFSADGRFLVLPRQDDGIIEIYDVLKGKIIKTLKVPNFLIAWSLSPDGIHIAVVVYEQNTTIRILDLKDGNEISLLSGFKERIGSLSYSPDGKYLSSRSASELKVWDVAKRQEVLSKKGFEIRNTIKPIIFSSDGKYLATEGDVGTIKIWNVMKGEEILSLRGHDEEISSLCFSPNGKYLISGSFDKNIKVWEITSGKPINTFKMQDAVFCVDLSPGGEFIIVKCGHQNNYVTLLELKTGGLISAIKGSYAKFVPNKNCLATYNEEAQQIDIWELSNLYSGSSLKNSGITATKMKFSNDGKFIAAGGAEGIKVWEIPGMKLQPNITRGGYPISDFIGFGDKGELFVLWGASTIVAYDVASGKEIYSFKIYVYGSKPEQLVLSKNAKLMAVAWKEWRHIIDIYDVKSQQNISSRENGIYMLLEFSPNGKYLASTEMNDNFVKIWNVSNGKMITAYRGHTGVIRQLSFSPDGRYLASGGEDKTIKIWDIDDKKEIITLRGHSDSISALCFSPDGKWLISGSKDASIKIWSSSDWREIYTLKVRTGYISSITFSPDGRSLVSSSDDQEIRFWDLGYFLNQLWVGLNTPYKKDEVIKLQRKVEQQTGLVLDGNTAVDHCEYFKLGKESKEKKEFVKCIEMYKKALEIKPNFLLALQDLGEAYFAIGNYDQAMNEFKKAIEINNCNVPVQFDIGLVYLVQEKHENAYNQFISTIDNFIGREDLHGLAAVQVRLSRAKNKISELIQNQPHLIFPFLIKGYLNKKSGYRTMTKADLNDFNRFLKEFKGDEKWKDIAKGILAEIDRERKLIKKLK